MAGCPNRLGRATCRRQGLRPERAMVPVVPYHVYWRVARYVEGGAVREQGISTPKTSPARSCTSRLDADALRPPTAVADMMKDPLFARFLPLIQRGDVTLMEWKSTSASFCWRKASCRSARTPCRGIRSRCRWVTTLCSTRTVRSGWSYPNIR